MEDYLVELYAWISSTDPTFEEREPYEEWKKKIGKDEKYQQELYGWIATVDNTFEEREPFNLWAEKVKKKGDSQLTSPEEQLEYDIPGEGDPGSSDISQEEADAALEGDLETVIGQVPDEFGGGDVVQYEAGRRRRGQRSAIERSDREIAAENRRRRDEGLPPIATGERDTWLERTVGKNEVTDFFGDLWRAGAKGFQTGNTIDENLELSLKGTAASNEDIQDFIRVNQELNSIGISDEMKAFNQAYDEAGGGAWGFIKGIMAAPTSITEIAVTSVAQMVNPAVAAAAGAGAAAGGGTGALLTSWSGPGALFGAGAGAIGGALGAAGATLEAGLSFSEFLQEELANKGLEMTKENVRKVLQDEDAMFRIRTRSAGRGAVIGIIDGLTAGIAGKVAGGVGKTAVAAGKTAKRANLKALAAATGVEGVGGGIGEAAARLAVGQDMDAAEIGFEAVGGAPGSVISAIRSMAGKGKYTMGPDDAEVTFEDMVRIIQETDDATFAGMKLNIKGDNVLKQMAEDRKNELKKKKAKIESLAEDLQGLSAEDANAAIDLEVELDGVRNAISRAKRRRKTEIESQLDEIYSRRGETVDIEGEIAAIDERLNEINNQETFTEQDIAEKNELEARKEGLQNQQQDAIQESSTTEVDVQEQTEDSETVGEGDAEGGVATEGEGETEVSPEATPQEIEQGADDLNELLNALGGAIGDNPVNLGDGFSGRNRGQEEGATTTEEIDQTTVEVDPEVQPDNNNVVVEDAESQTVEIAQSVDADGNRVMAPKRKGTRIKQGLTVVDNVEGEVDTYYQSDTYNTENPNQNVSAHEQRITRLADKAFNAIQKLFPDVNIVLHRSDQTYKDHVGKESRGAYKSATNTIHINMPKADALTIAHEVFHAVLKNKLGVEGKIQNVSKRMVNRLKKALKKSKNLTTEEQAALQDYADQFEGNLQNEEYLAELVGYLASTYKKLDVPARAVVKEWIQSILDFIGLDISIGDINADDRAVVDLLNVIAEKVTEGQELTAQDLQALDTEVGVEQQVEDQAKRDAQFTEEQVLEAPESRRGGRQIKRAFANLNKATTPEAQLGAIQSLLNNVSQGAVLTAQEQATIDQTLAALKNQGYELGKEVGVELASGDNVTLESLTIADNVSADATNTEGATKKVITKITKPQINKNGVMIQAAEVKVETQERTDAEIDAHMRKLEKLLQAEQKLGKDTSSTQKTIDALKAFKEKRGVTAPAVERRKAEPQRTETPQQEFDRKKAEQQAKDKAKAERKRKIEEDVRKEGGRKTPGVKFSGRLANYGDTVGTLILNPGDTFTVEATVMSDMDVQKFGPKNQPREFNVSIGDNGQFVLGRMDPNMDPRMVEEIKRFIDESNKEFRGRSDVSQIALLGLGGKLKNRHKPRGFKMDLTEVSGVSRDQGQTKTRAYKPKDVIETTNAKAFAEAQVKAIEKRTDDKLQVTILSEEDAQTIIDEGGKLFMTNDGKAGAYVTVDGYMGGLFKDPTATKSSAAKALQAVRVKAGGKFFDAFGTHLEDIYIKNGFRPVARMTFNEEFAPAGWRKTNLKTKPDNVFFVYDPQYEAIKGEGVRIEDYDAAYNLAKNFTPGQQSKNDIKTQKIMSTNNSLRNLGRQYNMNKQGFTPSYINLASLQKAARKLGFGVKKARGPQGGYYFTRNGRFVNVMENMTKTQIFKKGMSVGDVIKFARENNFTDAMIKDYLVRIEKMKVKDVNTLLALDADMFRRMPAVFGDVKGGATAGMNLFKRILKFNEKLKNDNKKRKTKLTEAEMMDATIDFMEKQPEFQAEGDTKTIESKKQMEMIVGLQKAMDSKPTKGMNTRLRSLRKSIRDRKRGAKNLQKVKAQLRNFIRQTLPSIKGSTYTRSELMGFIRKVTNANETNIDSIMDEVFDFVTKRQVKTLDAKIDSILNGKYEIVQSGRRKGVKIDNETRRRLEAIKKVITDDAATADDIVNSNLSLNEMFNALAEKVDQTEQDRNDMIDLMVVMSINNSKLMDDTNVNKVESLSRAEEMLSGIIGEGRQNFKEELKAAHEKYTEQFRKVFKDVTGRDVDVNDPDVVNEINDATDDLKRSAEATKANDNRVVRFIKSLNPKNLFVKAETIEGLMERIAEAPGVLLGGNARKLVYEGLNEGIRKYKKRILDTKKELKSKMKEIYGKKWRTINKDNSIKQVVDGVYTDPEAVQKAQEAYDADPTRKNKRNLKRVKKDKSITLSKNQVGYLYMQMQDPANAPAFENMKGLLGKDYKKTMDTLTEWAGPDVIAMAEWQMNEFYPSLYPGINDAYRDIYRTDLPWNENYGGRMYREGEVIAPLDLLGEKGRSQLSNSQVAAASTKERTATSKPIMPVDMMNALVTYTQDMEWFANVGPTIRDVNKLFTNPLMRKAIVNAKGEVTMDMIDHAIKNIANRGLQTEKGNQFVNSMNNLFATTRLGISPNIALKQLTSIPTYALDIGAGNYLYYAAKNKTQFLKVFNEIRENSVYLQDRLSTDIRQSIEAYSAQGLESNNPAAGAFTKGAGSFFVNMMMGFVKAGDITAIYLGGMPNYSYYKAEFMKANPEATNQEAIEYAVRKFESDTKSTQQSMDVTDKDYFQTSSPFNRALNMFKTSPKQYLRKEMSGLRNMRRGFRDKNLKQFMGGLNKFLMYHVMMPMGFQFVAAGMGLAGWDDEDNKDMARAAILGNFNALFIAGDILQGISNTLAGRTYGKDVGTLPVFDAFGEINEQYLKWIRLKDPQKKEEAFIRMTTRIGEIALKGGIPLYNITRFYKNIEKAGDADTAGEVILRLLNYSDYVIEGNERDTKSAPKTREERDNLKENEVKRRREEERRKRESRDNRRRR